MKVRVLTNEGVEQFRSYLGKVRSGAPVVPPTELLEHLSSSSALPASYGEVEVENETFDTKLDMARYLAERLKSMPRQIWRHDIGLWAWLALFYFDQLAPAGPRGRKLLADDLYIPSQHFQRRYRNLLLGPFLVYSLYGEKARLLLMKELNVWSDVEEQLLGVQGFVQIPGAFEAADVLYFDPVKGEAKRGITNRKKGGTIRRLREILQQLDLTFDIYLMTGRELVELLPAEFNRFKPQASQ